jgi:hypothetical protein
MNEGTNESAEIKELLEFGRDISEAMNGKWQPRCISNAFATHAATRFTLTMQAWIDLDAVRSRLLEGGLPATMGELGDALQAFGYRQEVEISAIEAAEMAHEMRAAVDAGFATSLAMSAPEKTETAKGDGFGSWLPIVACLVSQLGISPREVGPLPVAQALALIAATRRNQGWTEAGTPYALRNLASAEAENPAPVTPSESAGTGAGAEEPASESSGGEAV